MAIEVTLYIAPVIWLVVTIINFVLGKCVRDCYHSYEVMKLDNDIEAQNQEVKRLEKMVENREHYTCLWEWFVSTPAQDIERANIELSKMTINKAELTGMRT